jgi:hypothetical protein
MAAPDRATARGEAATQLAVHSHLDVAPLGTTAADAVVTPTRYKAPDAAFVAGPDLQADRRSQPATASRRKSGADLLCAVSRLEAPHALSFYCVFIARPF